MLLEEETSAEGRWNRPTRAVDLVVRGCLKVTTLSRATDPIKSERTKTVLSPSAERDQLRSHEYIDAI